MPIHPQAQIAKLLCCFHKSSVADPRLIGFCHRHVLQPIGAVPGARPRRTAPVAPATKQHPCLAPQCKEAVASQADAQPRQHRAQLVQQLARAQARMFLAFLAHPAPAPVAPRRPVLQPVLPAGNAPAG